jgi:phage tail-like protein
VSPYAYLDRDGRWPRWRRRGLDLAADGTLTLAAVPGFAGEPPRLAGLPAPDGPAGIAVAGDGTVFYSDPGADQLWRIDPCDGSRAPLPCWGGSGRQPARLRQPRGLLFHARRGLLLVADSGNHRIQLLDPATCSLAGIWGQDDAAGPPRPGTEPGRLDTPWSLAADPRGDVYVVDHGNCRVQKFDLRGNVRAEFWQRAAAAGMEQPIAVAVTTAATGAEAADCEVLVLDGGASPAIYAFSPAGRPLRRWQLGAAVSGALALAAGGGRIYVGDNASRAVLVLAAGDGTPLGEAAGFAGPSAALWLEEAAGRAGLWLHPGGGEAPVRLDPAAGHVRSGVLWGGPFAFGESDRPVVWHQVRCLAEPLAAGAHLQLYFATADGAAGPPDPTDSPLAPFAPPASGPPQPSGAPRWTALPADALQGLIRGRPARRLWLGAHLSGEGGATPRLAQVRVDFDPETWSRYLPAIYREQAADPELLERFLALFASGYEDVEAEIAGLGRYLDPAGAPASWLPWLAGWVGLELEETWSAARQREAIAGAFGAAARRGTVAGLAAALRFWAGVDARISEPILHATWWSLPAAGGGAGCGCGGGGSSTCGGGGAGCGCGGGLSGGSGGVSCGCGGSSCGCGGAGCACGGGEGLPLAGSRLGFDTVLAPAGIEGAVVGTTAVLDGSFLTRDGEGPGAHLYAEVAHQFAVQVYERQVADPNRRAQVIATLEREKPAHVAYHLCVVAPRLRVGFQARLGIDTVVGGQAPAGRLGDGPGLVLGGALPGRIGEDGRVGIGTRLGAGTAVADGGGGSAGPARRPPGRGARL